MRFLYAVADSVPTLGWSLFVVAMTSNPTLRSELISNVLTGATPMATDPAFALYYDTANGTALQGVSR
jgi:hypothetical protein